MSNNNQKRVVVITGSSRGIGKAIAKEFAKNNYSILLNARDEKELIETVEDIKKRDYWPISGYIFNWRYFRRKDLHFINWRSYK